MDEITNHKGTADLLAAIDRERKNVHTQSLDLSFNELLDMYKNKELDITPDYQRLFQWSEGARSRFIESLILEMPVPPIYVVEEEEGRYLLIDGLQRISSYLHLRGELKAEHLDPPVNLGDKLIFADCDIVKDLNGKTFDDLGTALQIRLKRAFVRVEVIRKGSNPRFKYYMFKRLNTGGQLLSEQQIRNCTIRLLDPKFNDFIIKLSKEDAFTRCIETLSQERMLESFNEELVLRFFALKNNFNNFKHDVSDFLTEYMEAVSDPEGKYTFDYEKEKLIFLKTFTILEKTLGENAFAYANKTRSGLVRGFGVYHFEAFTIGLQGCLDNINPDNSEIIEKLKDVFMKIKLDKKFIEITTGGGKNSSGPLKERVNFIKERVGKAL